MPDTNSSKKQSSKPKLDISFRKVAVGSPRRYGYSYVPISFYWLKDIVKDFVGHPNFPDALAIAFAIISVSIAFPFFPIAILVPLLVVTFAITMISPLGGLMAMLFETLPMFMYQAPLLAWMLTLFVSVALFLGHKNYRTITFVYALIMLPLSYLGYALEIPAFIMGSLFVGFRRAMASAVVIILLVAMLSGMTGIANSAPIVYDSSGANHLMPSGLASVLSPSKAAPSLYQFPAAVGSALSGFFSYAVESSIFGGFWAMAVSVTYQFELTAIQVVLWLIVIFAMTNYVIKSRSPYKGTEASFFSLIILAGYVAIASVSGQHISRLDVLGFVATPIIVFALEFNNVEVVKALSVMKQDFLGKFGEAFQELTAGTKETLNDVANYDETKDELRQAVLAPIEHREISGAYNVKPAKGILLFGPPGTGKTMLMRALSNEIRAKFFYVKTSAIVSPYAGESAQTLSKIFSTAKKSTPAVLFFDEIDGIAGKRESQDNDSSRQLLSTLLSEMDGFQKIEGVVIVGSTNAPQLLDQSIMRPGRFDKIIYMPLPDKEGRSKILHHYLEKLPLGDGISYQKLAEASDRYSGADIKNACSEVARQVADEAVKQRKVLQITMADIMAVIKATKPSTSLASVEKYNQFRLDFERRAHPEFTQAGEGEVMLDDVVGLDGAKKALYEAVEIPILHPNLVKKYDVQNIKGILLFGPPGVGKTMLMKAVAGELEDVKLMIVSGSDLAKNGLDNAVTEIRDVFNRARENAPCIIFIDEIDSLLPSRDDSSEIAVHMTSEFLQQLDGMKSVNGTVLVGATNRPEKIDSAMLRPGRMDRFIFVPPPSHSDRAMIFQKNLGKAPTADGLDYDQLASETEGFTGADIANICRQAKLEALEHNVSTSEEKRICTEDVVGLIHSVKPSAPPSILGNYMNFISLYGGR